MVALLVEAFLITIGVIAYVVMVLLSAYFSTDLCIDIHKNCRITRNDWLVAIGWPLVCSVIAAAILHAYTVGFEIGWAPTWVYVISAIPLGIPTAHCVVGTTMRVFYNNFEPQENEF